MSWIERMIEEFFPEVAQAAKRGDSAMLILVTPVHPLERAMGVVRDLLARRLYGMAEEYKRLQLELEAATPEQVILRATSGTPTMMMSNAAETFRATSIKYESKYSLLMDLFWVRVRSTLRLWSLDPKRLEVREGWQIVEVPARRPMGRRPSRGISGPEDILEHFFGFGGSREVGGIEDFFDIFFGGGGGLMRGELITVMIGGETDESGKVEDLWALVERMSDEELEYKASHPCPCGDPNCPNHRMVVEVFAERRRRAEAQKIADEISAAEEGCGCGQAECPVCGPAVQAQLEAEQAIGETTAAMAADEQPARPEEGLGADGDTDEPAVAVGETAADDGAGTPADEEA